MFVQRCKFNSGKKKKRIALDKNYLLLFFIIIIINLVFYAQSAITDISGRKEEN